MFFGTIHHNVTYLAIQWIFDGKTGIDLDYALVEYEQTKVSAFITEYQNTNGLNDAQMSAILDDISASMGWALIGTYVNDIMTEYFNGGSDFDFGNYQDRVILGQALIDKLHDN